MTKCYDIPTAQKYQLRLFFIGDLLKVRDALMTLNSFDLANKEMLQDVNAELERRTG